MWCYQLCGQAVFVLRMSDKGSRPEEVQQGIADLNRLAAALTPDESERPTVSATPAMQLKPLSVVPARNSIFMFVLLSMLHQFFLWAYRTKQSPLSFSDALKTYGIPSLFLLMWTVLRGERSALKSSIPSPQVLRERNLEDMPILVPTESSYILLAQVSFLPTIICKR